MKEVFIDYCNLLLNINTRYCEQFDVLLFPDIYPIEELIKACLHDGNILSFSIRPFRIALPYIFSHTIPKELSNIELIFDAAFEINELTINEVGDPLKRLVFNIILRGDETSAMASWHLDKHSQISSPEDKEEKFLHPEYHFTFGGTHMEDKHNIEGWDFGQTLILRSPRLMHPPMDIILGIDFILNHFIPRKYSNLILDNKQYIEITKRMKKLLWKPYAYAFAKNFFNDWSDNKDLYYNNDFCSAIIG